MPSPVAKRVSGPSLTSDLSPLFPTGQEWEPKYPEFASPDRNLWEEGAGGEDWVIPPEDSHLEKFRLEIGKKSGKRMIRVRFKATKTQPIKEYEYYFNADQAGDAMRIFQLMVGHTDPGEIVHSDLIQGRIPYKRVV